VFKKQEKFIIKEKWNARANEIVKMRSFHELENHFYKHLCEMDFLSDKKGIESSERFENKAWSLIDLCMFAIKKMGYELNLDDINYEKMLERIEVHEKYLSEQKIKEEEERKQQIQWERDNDTD